MRRAWKGYALTAVVICAHILLVRCVHSVWTAKHQRCSSLQLADGDVARISCSYLPYKLYFDEILEHPRSEFHHVVARSIVGMYDQLQMRIGKSVVDVRFPNGSWAGKIRPIGFSIPDHYIAATPPSKSQAFGRVIPGNRTTYYQLGEEDMYFQDMRRSVVCLTFKKKGWDCLRHLEILSAGCLPLFINLEQLERESADRFGGPLVFYPTELFAILARMPGLFMKLEMEQAEESTNWKVVEQNLDIHDPAFDPVLVSATTAALLQYTRNVLSTTAMASYLLRVVESEIRTIESYPGFRVKNLLYLTFQQSDRFYGDYLVDTLLHGLKKVLGEEPGLIVDFPRRSAIYRNAGDFYEHSQTERKQGMYGMGYTFSGHVEQIESYSWDIPERSGDQILESIENRVYDIVIFAGAHRIVQHNSTEDTDTERLWDSICAHYPRQRVVVLDGSDEGMHVDSLWPFAQCSSQIFTREGITNSPKPASE